MVTQINKNFVIRITDDLGTTLKGAGQYHKVVGQELADKHFNKVLDGVLYKYTFKLRRGLKIVFSSK